MAATEDCPVGNDMKTVETQQAQHEVCILFYYNIGYYSLPYSICRIPLAFWKQMPMNIPTHKMFSLCVCELFVKMHIKNMACPPEQDLGLFVFAFFLSVHSIIHSIKGAHDYLICALFNSEKEYLPVHDSFLNFSNCSVLILITCRYFPGLPRGDGHSPTQRGCSQQDSQEEEGRDPHYTP